MTDAFVVFQLVVKYLLFRRGFGVVDYFAHMEDQSVNEIIVEFLVTVENETQQIQIHHACRHLLQLLHGVIVHQCSVVGDTIVRDAKFGQEITGGLVQSCLLYTSDAADEEDSVDLGGRRIIKKKKNIQQ